MTSPDPTHDGRRAVYFVGTSPGKVTPNFFGVAGPIFTHRGIEARHFREPRDLTRAVAAGEIDPDRPCLAVLVYHEERDLAAGAALEELCTRTLRRCRLIHPLAVGRIIGDKIATNRALTAAGVLCPPLIDTPTHDRDVFQNAPATTQHPVRIVPAGEPLDPTMYNTEVIDTTYRHGGRTYHAAVRAMCAGGLIGSVFPRFRDIREGSPSVHDKNTPRDPALINDFWYDRIEPHHAALTAACARIGEVYGLGFYAHDFALCARTDRWFLLESGLKLNERTWARHVREISRRIVVDSSNRVIVTRLVHAFIRQLDMA